MDYWLIISISVFLISLILAGIIIPQILLIAFRKNLFDVPDERKIHKGVVPRLGGIAFMPSILFGIACILGVSLSFHDGIISDKFADYGMQLAFGSCALMLMFLVGMADDLIGVRYRAKFLIQIVSALFIVCGGFTLCNLHGFLGIYEMPEIFSWLLTILIVVYITNSINLIDGIDGLASGLSAVALMFYGIVFYMVDMYVYAIVSFATLGTLIPFFYYNVFGDPNRQKKIFMGDTGALTIGIIIAMLSIGLNKAPEINRYEDINPLVVAFSPLIIPCFDVLRVYLHRIRSHRNPFLPDKCHIHHKFLMLGIPQKMTMVMILMLSILFVFINLILSPLMNVTFLVIIDLAIYIVGNIILTNAIKRYQARNHIIEDCYQ